MGETRDCHGGIAQQRFGRLESGTRTSQDRFRFFVVGSGGRVQHPSDGRSVERKPDMEGDRAVTRQQDYGLSFTDALRECLNCAVIAMDHEQRITAFNGQAEKLTHLCATQVLGHSIDRLPSSLRKVLRRILTQGQPVEGRELPADDGTLRISAYPSLDADGKVGLIVLLYDLGAMEKLDNNMRQLDRLASVGALSASMAHEIKNAMVAIRTFVEVLVKENKSAELAEIVVREMRRIDSIVSQMLRLAGPTKPTFASIRLHTVLEHALHLVQHQLEGKKLSSTREFAARADVVRGDEYQLQQAFLNLFFNAIEAMSAGGQLAVTTETIKAPRSIRVSVSDTGSGIPPENLGRLFDAFFTTKQHGTGLGLPITRRIIQEHSGSITVESEVDKGTIFHVVLPI